MGTNLMMLATNATRYRAMRLNVSCRGHGITGVDGSRIIMLLMMMAMTVIVEIIMRMIILALTVVDVVVRVHGEVTFPHAGTPWTIF